MFIKHRNKIEKHLLIKIKSDAINKTTRRVIYSLNAKIVFIETNNEQISSDFCIK